MTKAEEKIKDIKENPSDHIHTFSQLQHCCIIDGALDLSVMDAHSEYINMGTNGGVKCDVTEGPCACGATH
jgi:hypothetical protein